MRQGRIWTRISKTEDFERLAESVDLDKRTIRWLSGSIKEELSAAELFEKNLENKTSDRRNSSTETNLTRHNPATCGLPLPPSRTFEPDWRPSSSVNWCHPSSNEDRMSDDGTEEKGVRSARITRHSDGTPLGCGIHLTGPDLLRLGIEPVETDVINVVIQDGELLLVPGKGEPVIVERAASANQKEQWREERSKSE